MSETQKKFKRPNIKHVGEGWSAFAGVMKYFRHILMGHEIFLKIFDGPKNLFLCSFLILTLNLFENLSGFEQKLPKLAIKRI